MSSLASAPAPLNEPILEYEPGSAERRELKAALDEMAGTRIEIPVIEWNGRHYLRISVQGYNTQADIDALVDAIHKVQEFFHV